MPRGAEALGYEEPWLVEDCFAFGGLTTPAAACVWGSGCCR
jgi:hypothetical protein